MMTETLSTDRGQAESDIKILEAKLDQARTVREQSLVRTPDRWLVVQIYSRQGERVSPSGIAKIVDLSQLRVLAYVDEVHIGRISQGGKVEVAFRGSSSMYAGRIARVAPAINRIRLPEPDSGSSSDGRVVQVEIELDDPSKMPQVIGREARVPSLMTIALPTTPSPPPVRRWWPSFFVLLGSGLRQDSGSHAVGRPATQAAADQHAVVVGRRDRQPRRRLRSTRHRARRL